jgi:hypothetical protein
LESSADGGFLAVLLAEPYHDFAEELVEQSLVAARDEVVKRRRGPDMPADGVMARLAI